MTLEVAPWILEAVAKPPLPHVALSYSWFHTVLAVVGFDTICYTKT